MWWSVRIAFACPNDRRGVAQRLARLSHPMPNPDLDLRPHKIPQFLQPATSPTSKYRSTPSTTQQNRQDGSPRRSPRWHEICLLSEFPGEGYDQALDLPQAVQVRWRVSSGKGMQEQTANWLAGSATSSTSRSTVLSRRGKRKPEFPRRMRRDAGAIDRHDGTAARERLRLEDMGRRSEAGSRS